MATIPRSVVPMLMVVALALGACGGDDAGGATEHDAAGNATGDERADGADPSPRPGESDTDVREPEPEPRGTEISTGESQLGEVLFDAGGQAIYYFDLEQTSAPECYGSCAQAWPPVLTRGEPRAGGSVRQGLLGTTERDDGATQVTYDGRPLYYYVDEGPGEVRCHNIFHEGGLWLAVQPDGEPVPHDPADTISLD